MKKLLSALFLIALASTGSNAETEKPDATACSSMSDFLVAGDRVLEAISTWPDERVPLGSPIHDEIAKLQDLAIEAMVETWHAHWASTNSWFNTFAAIHEYARHDFHAEMAVKLLGLFATAHPEKYATVMRSIAGAARDNRWIPGEFLSVCMIN